MVAPALIGALIGGAYGGLTYGQDKRQADAERRAQATFESTSPWTRMHGHTVGGPSLLGNIEGGALTGATFGAKNFKQKDEDTTAASPESQTDGSGTGAAQDAGSGMSIGDLRRQDNEAIQGTGMSIGDLRRQDNEAIQGGQNMGYNYRDPRQVGYSPWADMGVMPYRTQVV